LSNPVIDFLKEHYYSYRFTEKIFEGREKNAIVDLLVSKKCNNVFIGYSESTFSYYITKCLNETVKKILI
jgi:hypothetical protein